jgi:hypothetical protein
MLFSVVLLWLGLIRLPVLDNILPVRLMQFVYLLAGILVAVLLDAILRSRDRRAQLAGAAGLAISLILLLPAWPFPAEPPPVPEFFRSAMVDRIPEGSVALIAPFSRASLYGVAPVAWQAASGMRFRMPEGYVIVPGGTDAYRPGGPSPSPPASATQTEMVAIERGDDLSGFTEAVQHDMLGELASWKVKTVIVGPMPHQDRMIEVFTNLLGREPVSQGGVYVWWQVTIGPAS